MADFVAPQFQNPDILRSAALGQQMGQSAAMAPGAYQGQQQGLQTGQLNLDMLRQMMQLRGQAMQSYQQTMGGINGTPGAPQGSPQGPQAAPDGSAPPASNDPLAPFLDPRRIAAGAAMGQLGAMMNGGDPNKPIADALKLQTEARTDQIERAKIQTQPALNLLDSVFNSDSPARTVMANPGMMAHWMQRAPQQGLDPVKDFNDTNVRKEIAFQANQLRGQTGQPAKEYPVALQNQNLGQGEIGQFEPVTGKKTGDVTERQPPTFTLKSVWDPETNTTKEVPVQTGGIGMKGVGPTGNVASVGGPISKYPASAGALGFNTGLSPPKDPELKAAMFGSEMRSGMNTLTKMESQGFSLSPKTRTLLINAATSEDEGALKQFTSQVMLKNMTPQEQTYVAALMPVLQAAGHDQSGARLTTSQVRQNIESMLPVDVKNKDAMTQVNENRQGFYNGLLTQAGSAAQLPQYKNSLGADLKQAQAKASGHPADIQSLLDKYPKKP